MARNKSHHKISAGCVIFIAICSLGLNAILANATTSTTSKSIDFGQDTDKISDDLQKAETKDGKVEIIKQIQKLNNDGSYTVGYEAEDGTFKIESRDVLGNVKGTFGYIDINGEIKRVSYTANNGTGLKSSPNSSAENQENPVRFNRTLVASSTTRRPVYSSTTSSPTRGTVIQPIPRRLRVLSTSPLGGSSSTEKPSYREHLPLSAAKQQRSGDPTTTVVYATSVPTSKPYINIRPTPLPGTNHRQTSEQQISRPEKLEINHHLSQVQISSNTDASSSSSSKPVIEDIDEKDEEKIVLRGNSLRRQLNPEADSSNIYGSLSSTSRPLFASTNGPKIPALVLQARHRAAQIQNSLNSNSAAPEKYYIRPALKKQVDKTDEPTTEPSSEHAYLTQSPVPAQIPSNRLVQHVADQDHRVLRKSEHRNPQFVRIHPQRSNAPQLVRLPLPQHFQDNEQYLRETTQSPVKNEQIAEQDPISVRVPQQQPIYDRNLPQPPPGFYYPQQQEQMSGYYPQPAPYSYRGNPGMSYYGPDYQERPLTARDFERLLQLLILRHQYLQRSSNPYYGGYNSNPYFNGYPQPHYPRPIPPPLYNPYDSRQPFRPVPYPETENMYQAQNQIPQSDAGPMAYELQRLMPRKKQYSPRYFGAQSQDYGSLDDYALPNAGPTHRPANYLPPDVREELLYRMLMLALQSEPQASVTTPSVSSSPIINSLQPGIDSEGSTTTKTPITSYRKPVRSVQILGEEN